MPKTVFCSGSRPNTSTETSSPYNYSSNLIPSISQLSNTDITTQPTESVEDNDILRRLRRPRLECPENMIMYSDSKIM